jgi:hypothetical protein
MITSIMSHRQIIPPGPSPTKLTPFAATLPNTVRFCTILVQITPFPATHTDTAPVTLFPATHTKTPGGGVPRAPRLRLCITIPHRFANPLFSMSYELLFPQLLSFHKHLRCPIVFSKSVSHFQIRNFLGLLCVLCASALSFSFTSSEPFKRSDIPTFSPFSARMLVNP